MTGLMSMDSMQPKAPTVKSTMSPPGFAQINPSGTDYSQFGMDTVRKAQNVTTSLTNNPSDFSRFTGNN